MFHLLFKNCVLLSSTFVVVAFAQPVDVVPVRSEAVARTSVLTGEIVPYQRVTLHARVSGYVQRVLVDRGDVVKQGQLLVSVVAPELKAQTAEAESRAETADAARAEAEARLAGLQATYDRLRKAAETPGAIAGNELVQAEKAVQAANAAVRAAESAVRAARAAVEASKQSESYLQVTAPFPGLITERFVHPGALVGPGNGSAGALLDLEQVSRLRVVVPVPEAAVTSVRRGVRVQFRVPAHSGKTFSGVVSRVDRSLDAKTRTMAVELDVHNPRNDLSPGMYPQIDWPTQSGGPVLLVPPSAIVTTTERTFVIRLGARGVAEWVNVRRGAAAGDLVEVSGQLSPGDLVVRRASDEIREGARLQARKAS